MKKLLVSDITDTIYLANAKPVKGSADLFEVVGEKQDYTDEAIKAVYQWFLNKCQESETKFFQIRFGSKPWLTMDMRNTEEATNE